MPPRRKGRIVDYETPDRPADESIPPGDFLRIAAKLAITAAVLISIALLLWLIVRVAFRLRYGAWYWD